MKTQGSSKKGGQTTFSLKAKTWSVPLFPIAFAVSLAVAFGAGAAGTEPAKYAFSAVDAPTDATPAPLGGYAAGCLAGGARLPETGHGWQAMRLSRKRNWGHPEMIAFIERLSRAAQTAGWRGLYVGDISQPRGGPMVSSHRSHQIGLDADIWLRPPSSMKLSVAEREKINSPSLVATNRLQVNGAWTGAHSQVIKAAARDEAVVRIFVNAAIKRRLCESAGEDDSAWLRKVRPWWGHDSHFHVRLHCPDMKMPASIRNHRPRATVAIRNWTGGSPTKPCIHHRARLKINRQKSCLPICRLLVRQCWKESKTIC